MGLFNFTEYRQGGKSGRFLGGESSHPEGTSVWLTLDVEPYQALLVKTNK